ncbi:MAG: AAA family ATPase [Oscillospiraceae bacterium]|nr:AAA family ATPase [Oscillospiraceae bacterium]
MQFYKVIGIVADEKWTEENNDRRIMQQRARRIARKSEEFNQIQGGNSCYFISDIGNDEVTVGIIDSGMGDKTKQIRAFFRSLEIDVHDFDVDEITFSSMRNLLGSANRNDYISDDDEVLEKFELDRINGRYVRGIEYGENLLNEITQKEELFAKSNELLTSDTLTPELERIYSGKTCSKAFGHPVHYMIETNDRDTRKVLSRTLLQALFDNKRLQSRRYCFIDFKPGQDFSKLVYDVLYKSCVGGAILVRYLANDDSEDDNYASNEFETIQALCETMLKYRNQVLTVFCLPRECEKSKKVFFDNLGNTGIVEIREELADYDRAYDYLKVLAAKNRIRTDKKLFSKLEKDKLYLPSELRLLFDEWYNNKLKTSVFPQYKDLTMCRKEAVKEEVRGSAYDDLSEMIGLSEAKEVIKKALNYYKLQRIYKDKGIKQDRPAMHMVFTGNPGTAKTTVARLFARIMKENGLLSKGQLIEVGRGDLVAKYVGWTAKTVQEKFRAAMGGVLFIDEAYSLVEERGGSFGDEAINTIVQEMENHREDVVVIFAGYPNEMEKFLDKNPGLRSRIAFHVPFADYNTAELCDIARLIGKSKGVTLTESAVEKLSCVFNEAKKQPDFGNGRYVRNVLELSKMNHAARILEMDPEKVSDSVLISICAQDIEIPAAKKTAQVQKIGFGV